MPEVLRSLNLKEIQVRSVICVLVESHTISILFLFNHIVAKLNGNSIRIFPDWICDLSNLENLGVSYCCKILLDFEKMYFNFKLYFFLFLNR